MRTRNTSAGRTGSRSRRITKLMTPMLAAAVLSLASCGGGGQQEQQQQGGQQEQQGGATQQQGGGSTAAMQGGTTAAQGGTTMGGTTMGGTTMGGTTMGGTTIGGGTTMGGSGTPVSAIIDNPEQYYGQQVEVTGGVGQVIEPRALAMLDQRDLQTPGAIPESTITDRGLLVINTGSETPTFLERQEVRASGVLQPFDIATVEQNLGVDLDDELYTEYEDRPVLLTDEVRPVQGGSTQMETTGQ